MILTLGRPFDQESRQCLSVSYDLIEQKIPTESVKKAKRGLRVIGKGMYEFGHVNNEGNCCMYVAEKVDLTKERRHPF